MIFRTKSSKKRTRDFIKIKIGLCYSIYNSRAVLKRLSVIGRRKIV